ncbi:Hypothetical protein R9X50_00687100 [Acrodontium crateriforme]|uniref:Cleft lip and palate transmembrane 1 n=1 Tax=Acrodontium crateriforme TaxID=150365 RepID=A0AAQ3M8N1_9PEZI|nr:Hypothetical protein R9X50_00687100 [Acrodontium crateriforme]
MPEAHAGGAAAPQQGWEQTAWTIGKNVAMFVAFQYAVKSFMGGKQAPPPTADMAASAGGAQPVAGAPLTMLPLWPSNTSVDVRLYISPSLALPPLDRMPPDTLIVRETEYSLDRSKKDTREIHAEFDVPKVVQDNGTLWAHILIAQTGEEIDPASPYYNPAKAYRMLRPLTEYLPKKRVHKTRNLLESKNETEVIDQVEEVNAPMSASHYHPNFTLSFIPETAPTTMESLHPAVRQYYVPAIFEDIAGYYPVLYHNTFWQLKTHMIELNSTVPMTRLPINVNIGTLANWQFSVMASMDEGMKETARKIARGESTPGGGDGSELEMIKETLLDTNPWLLGTTVGVSILHMLFEMLAFKSDVGHWRNKKDNVGVSVRTILSNVFMQLVIFLYLLDNNDNTSWMILFGQGMGIAIEAWKITKTVDVRLREPQPNSWAHGLLPRVIVFEDKHPLSETEAETEEYDKIAFKYMGYIAVPLLLAYAAYSLKYETHKSWYSFVITTLVGSVYAYGFLLMVPSLYINYRLKSVAHMPGRTMAYKFLNTFIDDLFAFTIKMPLLHRLATLRDDVIFFVYLYQAWAYRVDYSRVNEFGQGGDDDEAEKKDCAKKDAKTVAAKDVKAVEEKVEKEIAQTTATEKGSAKKRKN